MAPRKKGNKNKRDRLVVSNQEKKSDLVGFGEYHGEDLSEMFNFPEGDPEAFLKSIKDGTAQTFDSHEELLAWAKDRVKR
jgi:hypothetical protein